MLKKFAGITLTVVAALALSAASHAQVIVQTFTVPQQAVSFNQNITFNKFDTSLGVLNSVTLSLNTSVTAEIDVFNLSGKAQTFSNATASVPVKITGPDGTNFTVTSVAGPISGSVSSLVGITPFIGNATATGNTTVAPANFGNYSGWGGGNLTVTFAGLGGTYSGKAPSYVFFGGSANAGGTLTLTYNYTKIQPIPEPGAATFLAAGVLGSVGMVIRRRRKKA
jgi:hypothetical protein